MLVGERIKDLREKRKLSIRQLGENLQMSFSHLAKIERGENSPSLDTLNKLADFFGVHISHFFGTKIEVPEQLKELGVGWIASSDGSTTPKELLEIKKFVENIKELQKENDLPKSKEEIIQAIEIVRDLKNGKIDWDKIKKLDI